MTQDSTPKNVADTATVKADIDMHRIMLLGVTGSEAEPSALIRLPNGDVAKVETGTKIGRERVVAIGSDRIALMRGGKAQWLTIPGS